MAAAVAVLAALGWPGVQHLQLDADRDAPTAASAPGTPSIAVLPFSNLSENPDQDFFADGMTEDLITDPSKLSGLTVIARNSVFAYEGTSTNVKQVAEALGVSYILEVSVRRAGGQVRFNAQLIDAATTKNVWADRYNRSKADVFALQDEVVGKIVSALKLELSDDDQAQLARIPTANMQSYDLYLRGRRSLWSGTTDGRRAALQYFQRAIGLDPEFADVYAAPARRLGRGVGLGTIA